jgi:hypothetical protein
MNMRIECLQLEDRQRDASRATLLTNSIALSIEENGCSSLSVSTVYSSL